MTPEPNLGCKSGVLALHVNKSEGVEKQKIACGNGIGYYLLEDFVFRNLPELPSEK